MSNRNGSCGVYAALRDIRLRKKREGEQVFQGLDYNAIDIYDSHGKLIEPTAEGRNVPGREETRHTAPSPDKAYGLGISMKDFRDPWFWAVVVVLAVGGFTIGYKFGEIGLALALGLEVS